MFHSNFVDHPSMIRRFSFTIKKQKNITNIIFPAASMSFVYYFFFFF